MKMAVVETLNFPPEIIFAAITDIPHHVDWVDGPFQLISLNDGPAKLGTSWEQNTNRLGKKLAILNTCNIYEANRKFGWKTEKPFPTQVTFLIEPYSDITKFTWTVQSEDAGIVQLVEPMLIKQTQEMIQKSLIRLNMYLQDQA